jgi:hypothetical protein
MEWGLDDVVVVLGSGSTGMSEFRFFYWYILSVVEMGDIWGCGRCGSRAGYGLFDWRHALVKMSRRDSSRTIVTVAPSRDYRSAVVRVFRRCYPSISSLEELAGVRR